MQAVILAGGLGTRLWPLTKELPKPMVRVAGVPYLERQVALLVRQGVVDIVLLTGHLGEQIEEHFGDGARLGARIRYSRETSPLGTGGALREAASLLAARFLLIYGDSYLPMEYREALTALDGTSALGLVVAYDNRLGDTTVRNNLAIDGAGFVTRYDKEAVDDPELTHVEAGVLAFRREVLDLIPASERVSLEMEVFPALIARRSLVAFSTGVRFYDIGTPDRLRAIEALFA